MVLADEVQVGFERLITHPEIETVGLYEDEIFLMASSNHPFAKRREVPLSDVARDSVIFFDEGSSYHALSIGVFRDTGVAPRHTLDVDNLEMAKHLVIRGLGLAFLPQVAVERELEEGTVVQVSIEDADPVSRQIAVIYRRQRLPSRAMLALLDMLKEIYQFEYANVGSNVPTG